MQNSQRAATEQNQNNLKPINLRKEKVEKGKNEKNQNNKILKKRDPEEKKKELELKSKILNKPIELLEFDALTHFKENIAHTYKNFLGAITEKSYYCLDCKHSDCPFYNNDPNQKEHRLIKKVKLYTYDNKFFNEVEKTINESLTYNQVKDSIKLCMSNSIDNLKNELDKLKERKFKEIDKYFEETDKYLLDLKNKYLNARQSLENYYKDNSHPKY